MRTVQGAALDGLRARVRALAARRRPERVGRSPRGAAPLADRGPALPGLGVAGPGRRTFVGPSFRYAASAPESTGRATLAGLGDLLRGLARPRPGEVRASAAALRALRARHGDAPALVRTRSGRTVLVLLDPQDLRRFYAEPVSVLAAAPPGKCRGAIPEESADSGCSRGELRAERRQVSAEVLAADLPVHPSCGSFLAALAEEARHLADAQALDLARARYAVHRAARRIVLGDAAAGDEELTGWLTQLRPEGDSPRGGRVRAGRSVRSVRSARSVQDRARARIEEYAAHAAADTLAGRAARHADPTGSLDPVGQAQHWLLAMDAVPETLLRTLLLLGAHPAEQDLAAAEAVAEVAAGADRGPAAPAAGLRPGVPAAVPGGARPDPRHPRRDRMAGSALPGRHLGAAARRVPSARPRTGSGCARVRARPVEEPGRGPGPPDGALQPRRRPLPGRPARSDDDGRTLRRSAAEPAYRGHPPGAGPGGTAARDARSVRDPAHAHPPLTNDLRTGLLARPRPVLPDPTAPEPLPTPTRMTCPTP